MCCEQARLNICKYRNANCNTFIENGYATDWTAFEYGKTARVIRLGGDDMSEQDLANVVILCCRVEPVTMQADRSHGNAYFLKPWIKDKYDEESMLALKSVITSQLIAQKKGKRSDKQSTILFPALVRKQWVLLAAWPNKARLAAYTITKTSEQQKRIIAASTLSLCNLLIDTVESAKLYRCYKSSWDYLEVTRIYAIAVRHGGSAKVIALTLWDAARGKSR